MSTIDNLPGQTKTARTFDRETASVPTARSWAIRTYIELGVDEESPLLDVCALLVSEIVTNAVVHGGGAVYTLVVCPNLWVEVWDDEPALPRRRAHALESEGGRGLELLEMLAPGYQIVVDTTRGGKGVRFLPQVWA